MPESEPWCEGELLLGAETSGPLVALVEPLSFWGGVDEKTGTIIDSHHAQVGVGLAGTALLMGETRGSSSASSVLLECIRRGTGPSVLLLTGTDATLVVAVAASWEIYGRGPSVVLLPEAPPHRDGGVRVRVDGSGRVYTHDDKEQPE